MRRALILAAAVVAGGAAGGSPAAGGTLPGRDGLIVLSRAGGGEPQASLVAVDPATGSQQPLGVGAEPAWSPDGTRLAFARDRTVYLANADGSDPMPVATGNFPAWSPDGTKLVVSRYDGAAVPDHPLGTLQLFVLGLTDGSTTQLTDLRADATLPAWSPDGGTIAFATPTGLATVAAAGGDPTPLSLAGATVRGGPSWSPDGRALAFVDAGGQVWTAAADGAGARQLTYTLAAADATPARPAWAPDGASIAFTAGPDLCVSDLAGNVHRVTRSPQTAAPVVASLPDWQTAASGSSAVFDAPRGPSDSVGCDWNPGARIELLEANASPSTIALAPSQQLVFVNHLTRPLTVTTTLPGTRGTVDPGRYVAFDTEPGEYDFTVVGYPDGVPRRGTFVVAAAGRVSCEPHAALRYGSRTLLTGAAVGPAGGTVAVSARPYGASAWTQLATVKPAGGRWQLSVAPSITTRYEVRYEGATAERLLRVMPALRVRRSGSTVRASMAPAARLAGRRLYLFRLQGKGWSEARSARLPRGGGAVFRKLAPGRYYVGFAGDDAYWGTAGEPFTVRR